MGTGGKIVLRKVAVHNLKNIDLDIPHRKLVVICGVSGSGKSSLALDTLYAEGQRRYIESFRLTRVSSSTSWKTGSGVDRRYPPQLRLGKTFPRNQAHDSRNGHRSYDYLRFCTRK